MSRCRCRYGVRSTDGSIELKLHIYSIRLRRLQEISDLNKFPTSIHNCLTRSPDLFPYRLLHRLAEQETKTVGLTGHQKSLGGVIEVAANIIQRAPLQDLAITAIPPLGRRFSVQYSVSTPHTYHLRHLSGSTTANRSSRRPLLLLLLQTVPTVRLPEAYLRAAAPPATRSPLLPETKSHESVHAGSNAANRHWRFGSPAGALQIRLPGSLGKMFGAGAASGFGRGRDGGLQFERGAVKALSACSVDWAVWPPAWGCRRGCDEFGKDVYVRG